MNTKIPRIAFVGDLTVDYYVNQNETHLGGSSLTGAIWASRLGAVSSIVAAVGSDEEGHQYINVLTRKHIDATGVSVLPGKTSTIDIITTKDGERQYGAWDPGVLKDYRFRKKDIAFMKKQDAVVLSVYDKTVHLLKQFHMTFEGRKRRKPIRVVDFGDLGQFDKDSVFVQRFIFAIDIAVFGLDKDIDEKLINDLRLLAHRSGKLILITLNRFGAIALKGPDHWGHIGREASVVDATGAGDSFLAAFLVSYLSSGDIEASLQKGSALAARVIGKVGAY